MFFILLTKHIHLHMLLSITWELHTIYGHRGQHVRLITRYLHIHDWPQNGATLNTSFCEALVSHILLYNVGFNGAGP